LKLIRNRVSDQSAKAQGMIWCNTIPLRDCGNCCGGDNRSHSNGSCRDCKILM